MKERWRKRAAALVAGLMFFASSLSVLAAVQGSQDNPLVTLSYLKDVFTKTMLQETDQKIATAKTTYEKNLDDKIAAFTKEMQSLSGSGSSGSSVFTVVDLQSGQALTGSVGCELMLRVGSAQCVSQASPGLIDATSGGILENGNALAKNHLYLVSIDGRSVKAVGGTVKLLVRGSYTIQ